MGVTLQAAPFDPGALTNAFIAASNGAGAAVIFTGLVRSLPDDPISALTLEHYETLARRQLEDLRQAAIARFGLVAAEIVHRHGTLHPSEPIVQVMTLAPHRQAAFEAASFIMDRLKTDAPFWKKETRTDGTRWVEAKASDDDAASRWD